jgi:hypothetical protein
MEGFQHATPLLSKAAVFLGQRVTALDKKLRSVGSSQTQLFRTLFAPESACRLAPRGQEVWPRPYLGNAFLITRKNRFFDSNNEK